MFASRTHGLWWFSGAIAAALTAGVAALLLRPRLEHAVRTRIEAAAAHHGMVARIGRVRVGVWPLLRLENFDLDLRSGMHLHVDMIAATWPGHLRLTVGPAALAGPAGLNASSLPTAWDITGIRGGELRLTLAEPQARLSIRRRADPLGNAWSVEAQGLDVGRLLKVRRDAHALLDGGIAYDRTDLQARTDALHFHVDMSVQGARMEALADNSTDEPELGNPTDVALRFDGAWSEPDGTVEIPEVEATVAGAALSGSIELQYLHSDPVISLALGVKQLDFAQALRTSGLAVPESLGIAPGGSQDLGAATIDVRVHGHLADPASLTVSQKIEFKPPRPMPPGIARLRRDFIFDSIDGAGRHRSIDVSPASPDFIALSDVPPLFVRTLLLAEDAGFYGHRGIDLRELPTALLTNWSRGGAARGASTISQQLSKNLFLSFDKQFGRKLQELAITFLLESALGKNRILEIYLNIIEWGPDLRGLRPAARAYFGCEPQALTPAEIAFLVTIIPGPIKYQSSFAHGKPGPGLTSLIDGLLAKLRSVDAISEEEYRRALEEPIVVGGSKPSG